MAKPTCTMRGEVLRIGRQPDSDWVLQQDYVSRNQLIVFAVGGLYLLQCVGSCPVAVNTPATQLARDAIVAIKPGDRICMDDIEIRISIATDEAPAGVAKDDMATPAPVSSDDGSAPIVIPDISALLPRDRHEASAIDDPEAGRPAIFPELRENWWADRDRPDMAEQIGLLTAKPGTLADVLEGAGYSVTRDSLTDSAARELGVMLRVCVEGLGLVLTARGQVRHKLHVAATQLTSHPANPLKAAAPGTNVCAALIDRARTGDGSATATVSEAFDDIRYHQIAMLSGHRVAFDHVLREFHPESLKAEFEQQYGAGGFLSSLERGQFRKLYVRKFGALLSDPEDAYRTLFRERFANAYEQTTAAAKQMARERRASPAAAPAGSRI